MVLNSCLLKWVGSYAYLGYAKEMLYMEFRANMLASRFKKMFLFKVCVVDGKFDAMDRSDSDSF